MWRRSEWHRSANSRIEAQRLDGGRCRLRAGHLQQESLPQPEGAHLHLARLDPLEQLGGDRQARENDVAALGIEAGDGGAALGRHARQPFDQVLDLRDRDRGAVHRVIRSESAPRGDHPSQVGEGTTGADERRRGPVAQRQLAAELAPQVFAQLPHVATDVITIAQMQFRQTHRPEGE